MRIGEITPPPVGFFGRCDPLCHFLSTSKRAIATESLPHLVFVISITLRVDSVFRVYLVVYINYIHLLIYVYWNMHAGKSDFFYFVSLLFLREREK